MSYRSRLPRHASPRPVRLAARSARSISVTLLLLLALALGLASFPAFAQTDPPPPTADLGDAPDSTSHSADVAMSAYPGVPASFPTVFDGPEPRGPRHQAAKIVWLGNAVSAEQDADQLPDEDQLTNIDPGGAAPDANRDGADDGWLNRQSTIIRDCAETLLRVQVRRNLDVAPDAERLFLNVWYDGTRDGDWADTRTCPDQQRVAFEWIVQNFPIAPAQLANGGAEISVPTFLVLDAPLAPEDVAPWVRFTLSEQPVPRLVTGAPADGRGPPNGYAMGETEDYRYERSGNTGDPGTLVIRKAAVLSGRPAGVTPNQAEPLKIGDVFSYTLSLQHQPPQGGQNTGPLFARAVDQLPPEVELINGPRVTVDGDTSAPFATFDPNEGPSGTVRWEGALAPGAFVGIEVGVRVRVCRPEQVQIRNVLRAFVGDAAQEAVAEVPLLCRPPDEPPENILTKRILFGDGANAEPRVEVSLPPGEALTYLLTLAPTSGLSETLRISDTLPLGLEALGVEASQGRATIVEEGRTVLWEGRPSAEPTRIWIRARLTERARCDDRLVNIAYWYTEFHRGPSNPTTLRLACADLGDAPDSTNHPSAAMSAYAGVPAAFPTVFDGPDPRGPKHLQPRPLHLGRGVSAEVEADIGPDVDGVNNIVPQRGRPDLDRFDDGLAIEGLRLTPCETPKIPVSVLAGPDLAALITGTEGRVYLNVWYDGNRDGDWADTQECPGANVPAREHLVIDYPIKLSDLAPGPNPLLVPGSGPAPLTAALATRPAWLRVTLSERPSNKVLPVGCAGAACTYGDGRGYAEPFRFGETEDYLLLGRPGDGQADPTVRKRGSILPFLNQENGQSSWLINWAVEYFNSGNGVAEDVTIVDTLEGPQTRSERGFSAPPLTPTISGQSATYRPGYMVPGQVGFIGFQTTVPFGTAPGTVLTNTVVISASNDFDPTNNTAVVSVTVPLLPPLIIDPISGDSCEGALTVRGRAQAGSTVQLYVDGAASGGPIAPAGDGSWSAELDLADGEHSIYAVATQGGVSSDPSPTIVVNVDSTLTWSPISLRFTDADGHVFTPRDENGRASETGWRVWLRPNTTYTVSVRICCEDANAVVTIEIPGVGEITLTESAATPGLYEGSFTTGDRASIANGTFRICVTCNLIRRCSDGTVLIDPLGVVYDASKGIEAGLLSGAVVACYEEVGAETRLWPASAFGQLNPQTTAADGFFSFYTPPGLYQLQVSRAGFHPFRSADIVVTDAPVIYNVPLTPLPDRDADYTIYITENGFEPSVLEVPNGAVVRWVNLTGAPRGLRGAAGGSNALAQAGGWDSGMLNTGDGFALAMGANGTFTVTDPDNPTASATLIVSNTQRYYLPILLR